MTLADKLRPDRFTAMSGRMAAADLTPEERAEFERRYRERVDDWRPVLAGPASATDRLTRPGFGAPAVRA